MGKRPRKTKELSVAIAEASLKGEEEQQQQSQSLPQTPRKRGRPRKVVEKKEQLGEEEEEEEEEAEDIEHGLADEDSKSQPKSVKTSEPEEQQSSERGEKIQIPKLKEEGSPASVGGGEIKEERRDSLKQPSRSRARRKSKPRKSS